MFGVLVTGAKVSGIILYKNTTRNAAALLFFLFFGNYSRNYRAGYEYGCRGDYYNICCCGYVSRGGIHRSQKCERHGNYLLSVLVLYYYTTFPQKFQQLLRKCRYTTFCKKLKSFCKIYLTNSKAYDNICSKEAVRWQKI